MNNKKIIIAPESKKNITEVKQEILEVDQSSDDSPRQKRLIMRADLRGKFINLSDHVAESSFYFRNHKFKEADQVYPDITKVFYRFVTKYYPHAKKGPLLVDEPRNKREMDIAYEKQKVLKKLGYRHIVIEDNTTLYDCLEQLGEL